MSDALPEISETCRCGSSTRLVGVLATDDRLREWREFHRCMTPDEERFRDVPSPTGATASFGFARQLDHDRRPVIR